MTIWACGGFYVHKHWPICPVKWPGHSCERCFPDDDNDDIIRAWTLNGRLESNLFFFLLLKHIRRYMPPFNLDAYKWIFAHNCRAISFLHRPLPPLLWALNCTNKVTQPMRMFHNTRMHLSGRLMRWRPNQFYVAYAQTHKRTCSMRLR